MEIIAQIVIGIILVCIVISMGNGILTFIEDTKKKNIADKKKLAKTRENIEKEEEEKEYSINIIEELTKKYGKCSVDIRYGEWSEWNSPTLDDRFLVFEDAKIVIINKIEYNFSKILDCSLVDDSTMESRTFSKGNSNTSTGNMLGRAVVGGVIGGGIGALAGANTAKRNNSSESFTKTNKKHHYVIYLNIDSLKSPMVKIETDNRDKAYTIANTINIIIKRNNEVSKI